MSESRARHFFILLALGVTAALSPVSMDMLAPSLPQLSQDIGITAQRTELTIYAFLIGYGLAPSVWGRLSDNIGRRPVMLTGMLIYILSSVACAFVVAPEQLIALRGVQGIGAAAGATVARAIVRDIYGAAGTARGMSRMISLMAVVPFFMPLLGGLIARQISWEACFAGMALIGFMSVFFYWVLVGETLPVVVARPSSASKPISSILGNRVFTQHALCNMFVIAMLVLFGANFSFILVRDYQFDSAANGMALALFNGSIAVGTYLVWALVPRLGVHRSILAGGAMCTLGWLAIALQAWAGLPGVVGLAVPLAAACLGCGVIMSLCSGSALAPFSHNSGTASSIYLLVQSMGATGISFVAGQFIPKQLLAMALAMACCGALALVSKLLLGGGIEVAA
jgi:DHA1 family bicyclomycin/chloramphenicol resistance-like MFS transporter